MDEDSRILQEFSPLYGDLEAGKSFPNKRPLLAHYTSIETLERVMSTEELWFSNPLFMNDLEELRFGVIEGGHQFFGSETVKKACGSELRAKMLHDAFRHYFDQFSNEHALDIYVFCLSEHDANNSDGLLSMWRGYGGNGKGAAIVFDTNQVDFVPLSPLVLSRVIYASTEERREWLDNKLGEFAVLLKKLDLPDEKLYLAAWAMFERIKLFAIFTKHHGFSEEREWRVAYLKERDRSNKVEPMLSYAVGNRGIEPKLKFRVAPMEGVTANALSLSKIIHQIILGPSVSTPLAMGAILRMLDKIGKPELKDRVKASGIPFRI